MMIDSFNAVAHVFRKYIDKMLMIDVISIAIDEFVDESGLRKERKVSDRDLMTEAHWVTC